MNFFRLIFSLPFAALITAGLFAMMAGLISQDKGPLPAMKNSPDLQILADFDEPKVIEDQGNPNKIKEEMPETVLPITLPTDKPKNFPVGPDTGPIQIDPPKGPGPMSGPIVRQAPVYPEGCRGRNAEGTVLVQFDVTPEGNVVNVQILESANACFNRTVRNTVVKWKYAPAYENGRPVMRYGIVERIKFELTD